MNQTQIGLEVIIHCFLLLALLCYVCYVEPLVGYFTSHSTEEHQSAIENIVSLNISKWPLFIMVILSVFLFVILFSHRVVGPIYKLQNTLKQFSTRDFSSVFFLRRFDYFQSVVPHVEEFRLTMSEDIRAVKNELEAIKQLAPQEAAINAHLEKISSVLDAYKLGESQK